MARCSSVQRNLSWKACQLKLTSSAKQNNPMESSELPSTPPLNYTPCEWRWNWVWRMYHAMKLVLVLFIWIVDSCCTSSEAKLCDNVDVLVLLHCLTLKLYDWVLPVHILDICLWDVTGSSEFRWGHWKLSWVWV
jgi:hypothetical protein